MLSDVEKQEVEAEIARSHDPRAASVGALRIVQGHRGYVPDEALAALAPLLGMTPGELDSVASFYSLIFRRPVGRKVLKVCDSLVCSELGGDSLMARLEDRLGIKRGETTPDGEFTLLPICCLGDCDHAPVMMVDDTLVRNVTTETVDKVLSGELPEKE
jgi:NADH-quinone oxidoreductase subunit E